MANARLGWPAYYVILGSLSCKKLIPLEHCPYCCHGLLAIGLGVAHVRSSRSRSRLFGGKLVAIVTPQWFANTNSRHIFRCSINVDLCRVSRGLTSICLGSTLHFSPHLD